MDISFILSVFQLILGIGVIALVLIQQQDTGFYSSSSNINRTRRGVEKLTYNLSIVVITLFALVSIANFLV